METSINGIVLADQDRKVVRWCLNTLARIGTKDGCATYVTAALKLYADDTEITAAAIAALARIFRGRLDEVQGLGTVDPSIRILAAMQTTDIANLDVSNLRIDIDNADVEVLKLALLTVGLNRDIENLLHPKHTNGTMVKQLGQHDDRIVKQYSVWCVMENRYLTLEDLGIPFEDIDTQPSNVQAKLLQLGAEREVDARRRHELIHDGTFNRHPEARVGLARGLKDAFYDGLEDITINWYDVEQERAVQVLLAEHFARFSDASGPYADKSLELLEADPSLLEYILLGAEGRTLYGRVRALGQPNGMSDLFGRPIDLGTMFQASADLAMKARSMKVLFLAANPADQVGLRVDAEARDLREQIALVRDAKTIVEIEHAWAVRTADIQREILNNRPEVLHFSGHGAHGILAFESQNGETMRVSGEALADLISLCSSIKCVVLNSCFSDSIAALIAPHVDAVIGCETSVSDGAASQFTTAFYRALAHGEAVQRAFRLAKNDLALQGQMAEADKYKVHSK